MSVSSYNKQLLATQAAAWIAADGSTSFPIGCSITRIATGQYRLTLPTGEGLVDIQTFSRAQVKGTTPFVATVVDVSELEKDILTFATGGSTAADAEIEVVIERSTINLP
jgi:hypothetical protein